MRPSCGPLPEGKLHFAKTETISEAVNPSFFRDLWAMPDHKILQRAGLAHRSIRRPPEIPGINRLSDICHFSQSADPILPEQKLRSQVHRFPPGGAIRHRGGETPSARQLVRRFRDQAALRTGSGNLSGMHGPDAKRRVHRCAAASSAARASTPCGDQLIPLCLQRADTAQSLYFSTRVLAIHNPARCRCW